MKNLHIIIFLFATPFFTLSQSIYFPPTSGNWETTTIQDLNWCDQSVDSLYTYLSENNSKAFMLLYDGKIVLEQYFSGHTQSDSHQWASAGKTISAFMTGIAQQENFLSIQDKVSNYLGVGWTNCSTIQEEKIKIIHQLTMTTGLDENVSNNFCTTPACLIYKSDAGTRWSYHNAPYTLLQNVLETATQIPFNTYVTNKLKIPTGMTGSFINIGYNSIYFSTARSMARFGILIQNKGNWNGNQILTDTNYFNQMIKKSQNLNESYGYLWWLNQENSHMLPEGQTIFHQKLFPDAPGDLLAALGTNSQLLNISTSKKIIWLRMGDAPNNNQTTQGFNNEIWKYIQKISCQGLHSENNLKNIFKIYPNPTTGLVCLETDESISSIIVYDLLGNKIENTELDCKKSSINLSKLPKGIYILNLKSKNGEIFEKIVLE